MISLKPIVFWVITMAANLLMKLLHLIRCQGLSSLGLDNYLPDVLLLIWIDDCLEGAVWILFDKPVIKHLLDFMSLLLELMILLLYLLQLLLHLSDTIELLLNCLLLVQSSCFVFQYLCSATSSLG